MVKTVQIFKPFSLAAVFLVLCGRLAFAATYNVITPTADVSTPGSLAWCIVQANTDAAPDIIEFDHASALDPATNSITVHAPLTITYPVYIHGNQIKVACINVTPQTLFSFQATASGSTVTGLALVNSSYGILINANSNCHLIYNNRIGTDWSDTLGLGNNTGIMNQGKYVCIGRNGTADRNVISNNSSGGISLSAVASHTTIVGNYIGLNNAGSAGLGTQIFAMDIFSRENRIGGDRSAGLGNVIANHTSYGIVFEGAGASGNTVCGNIIGLNAAMDTAYSNSRGVAGVSLEGNFIGLPVAGYENIIAGNSQYNINFWDVGGVRPANNVIQNNYIGTNPTNGVFANGDGIYCNNTDRTLIGGNASLLEENFIAGNTGNGGIYLIGNSNTICGNYIGTQVDGSAALANSSGIRLSGYGNLVGGYNAPSYVFGNIISGNNNTGFMLTGGGGNTIVGNIIGLSDTGDSAIPNGAYGIYFASTAGQNNLIGEPGMTPWRNIISGNTQEGIRLETCGRQIIAENYIGLSFDGTSVIQNGIDAVTLSNSRQVLLVNNIITETINLYNVGSFGNTLTGNRVGVLPDGSAVAGMGNAMYISSGAHGNFIGQPDAGPGNLFANCLSGVVVSGSNTVGNGIFGNTITAFSSLGIQLSSLGNISHAAPSIHMADTTLGVSGTAQPNDYIEVFIAENAPAGFGGSIRLLGYTTADSGGDWSLPAGGYTAGEYLCATASDSQNNTSQFSANLAVSLPAGSPTFTPSITPTNTPTVTHSPTISPTPTISATYTHSPVASATPTVTPTPTASPTNALAQVSLEGKMVLAYPNPANQAMKFLMHLDSATLVRIDIFNPGGERIATLEETVNGHGQILAWDCSATAPGVYIALVYFDGKRKETFKLAVTK